MKSHRQEVRVKPELLIAIAGLIISAPTSAQAQEAALAPTRTVIQEHDLSGVPGREIIQAQVDFAPGAQLPKHTHPGDEISYVLEGAIEYRLEGQAPITLEAGHSLFIPAGTPHSARNAGSVSARAVNVYVVEKGEPLLTPVN
jgi:quercetin dioxygenase-like cupin family protein